MSDNPIYLHLTQNSRQPSKRMERLLQAVIGVVGGVVAVAAVYYMQASGRTLAAVVPVLALGISSLGFVIVAPSLALIVTALFTGKDTHRESLTVLLLTNISARQIADGYIRAVVRRLRLLQVIGIGLIPQAVIILAYFWGWLFLIMGDCIGPNGIGSCEPDNIVPYLFVGCIPALFTTGMLAAIGVLLLHLAVYAGVWVGFRWGEKATIVAGGILLAIWVILIPLLTLFGLLCERYLPMFFPIVCVVSVVVTTVPIPFLRALIPLARRGTYWAVERMRQMQ